MLTVLCKNANYNFKRDDLTIPFYFRKQSKTKRWSVYVGLGEDAPTQYFVCGVKPRVL